MQISIPKSWPIIGGETIAEAAVRLSTEEVYAKVKIIGIGVAISYEWGSGDVGFDLLVNNSLEKGSFYAKNVTLVASTRALDTIIGENGLYVANLGDGNIPFIISSYESLGGPINLSEDNLWAEIDIQNQDNAVIQLSYFGDIPEYENLSIGDIGVVDPQGRVYNLIDYREDPEKGNSKLQILSKEESDSGMTERHIYIAITSPENGTWKIQSAKPISMVQLMNVGNLPEIRNVEVKQDEYKDHIYTVYWDAENITEEKVAIFLCKDNVNDPGIKIADEINAAVETYIVGLPEAVESGKYYFKVVLYKDGTNMEAAYSDEAIRVTNPNEPGKPGNLKVSHVGDGLLNVTWSKVTDADGYYVQVFDKDGKPLEGVGIVEVGADETDVVIGGTFADSETGELMGLIPGKSYKVGVTAFRRIGETLFIGETAMSSAVMVPEPDPAIIELKVEAVDSETILQNGTVFNGMPMYTVNRDKISLKLNSDKHVTSTILLNDKIYKENVMGKEWAEEIALQEGNNIIEVFAVNDMGDSTLGKVSVLCDTTPPALSIENPERIVDTEAAEGFQTSQAEDIKITRMSENEKYLLRGIAEPGARVKVDGKEIAVSEDGIFEMEISLTGYAKKNIVIEAVDAAGNTSRIIIPVLNDKINNFKDIVIREAGSSKKTPLTSTTVKAGGVKEFAVYGITDRGEFLVDPEDIEWDIILGEGLGEITNKGELHAYHEGELLLTASYKVSEDFTFTEGVKVTITPDEQGTEPGSGKDKSRKDRDIDRQLQELIKGLSENVRITFNGITISASLSYDEAKGIINLEITDEILEQLFIEKGEGEKGELSITLPQYEGAKAYSVTLPASLLASSTGNMAITVNTPNGSVKMDNDILKSHKPKAGDKATIVVGDVDSSLLSQGMEGAFEGRPVRDITIMVNNAPISWESSSKTVEIFIPYKPASGKNTEKLSIWYDDGTKLIPVPRGRYDSIRGGMVFEVNHLSRFAVGLIDKAFADMEGFEWARDAVEILASKGIINGTSATTFSPERDITRADFTLLLVRMLGLRGEGRDNNLKGIHFGYPICLQCIITLVLTRFKFVTYGFSKLLPRIKITGYAAVILYALITFSPLQFHIDTR